MFYTYEYTSNADYSQVEQRIVWDNAGALQEIDRRTITGNPLCLAASQAGTLFASWGDHIANKVHVLRWSSPTASPQEFIFDSDQGGSAKFSCLYDETRQVFWFIGTGFELLKISEQGQLLNQQDIADYVAPFHIEYPALKLASDGSLDLGWTVVDLRQPVTSYRSMHYLRSTDGMNWSNTGAAPFLASPGQEVRADELGPAFNIAPDQLDANTQLTSLFTEPNGAHHFTWFRHPETSGDCFIGFAVCTLGYRNSGMPNALTEFSAGSEKPRAAFGGAFGMRGNALYFLTGYSDKAVAFKSTDHGMTWSVAAETPVPNGAGKCLKDFTGVPTDTGFAGSLSFLNTDCPGWIAGGTHKVPTRLVAWSIALN